VQYDEAMAILVGDALLTRALGLLGEAGDPRGGRLVAELASAAGGAGMIAGQVADMDLCTLPGGADGLWYIHQRKTAALLVGAVRMGAICGGADDVELQAVSEFARCLGLAYQVTDDLLDVTGTAEDLGKTPGKDARTGKRTSVSVLGLEDARGRERQLTADADQAIKALGPSADPLRNLAGLLVGRTF
jgi:geranylgeranyl diphosphate synthase, type II